MLFVEICVNNLFIFLVSFKTIFQSWFLSNGNLIFFPDIILFKFFIIISFFCVSVCSVLFGYVFFRFLLLCGSFRPDFTCFSVCCMSIIVLGSFCYDCIFTFRCISNISR